MATTTSNGAGVPVNGVDNANGIVQDDAKGRVPVHVFDPNASPAEKAAAAGKARDQLKPIGQTATDGDAGKELPVAKGGSNIIPTINVQDTDAQDDEGPDTAKPDTAKPDVTKPDVTKPTSQVENGTSLPGGLPDGAVPAIPDWYKVGWRAVSGIDAPPLPEGEEKDKGILDLFLAEQFYGTWYHNSAVVFFAVFASHFLTRFHFGWGWLFIVLAACNTYYSTSMARVRRRARDDIQRELVKTRLASEHESADWINNFMDRFWLIYEPVLSATVVSSVDQILSMNTPPFLDSLRLTTFTLGTKAPRIDKVRTFPKTADDVVMMDWAFSFTPNDISDMTPRQAANKVNPKIVLSVRFGKGLATAAMPVLLEDITFSGLMRIRMKLMTNFPHVQIVDICFLEKPVIDYVLKPLGGDTFGLDINHIPGLSAFIRDMTHATLGPMMYDPNVFTLNLEQLLSGAPLDAAIGVVQVTVHSARGIKASKLGGGTPDPFVSLSINERAELARTKYKHNTANPTWMETKFILVNSLTDSLVLSLFDFNDHRKNTLLGSSSFSLDQLQTDATREGCETPILKDGKDRGLMRYDVSFYPVLKSTTVDGKEELPETSVGIVRLVIHQAKELDASKSLSGDLNPFAKVQLGHDHAIHSTPRFKHTNNPVWESATEFLCADRHSTVVVVKVVDDRDFLKDPLLGYMSIRLEDLLNSKKTEAGRDWWPLSGCRSGKIRLSAEWKPLNMAGSLHGADQFRPPIGVVRLWLDKATDVKNVEAALGGKSDPYVRIQVNNVTKGRTEVINNNLNPKWDQFVYVPVHSLREHLLLEVMDFQNLTRDRSLGSVELKVSDIAKESGKPDYPYEGTGVKEGSDPIKLDGQDIYKGKLHYTAEFVPALALKGIEFENKGNEVQRATEGNEDDDGDDVTDGESIHSIEIPDGITTSHPVEEEDEDEEKTHSRGKSNDTSATKAESIKTSDSNKAEKSNDLVELSREELLTHQSGVVIFNVLSGQLAKKSRLEVLLDDAYWPAFATSKSRSPNARWDHIGEAFLKELDFGRVWLRLDESDNEEKDDIVAEWKGDAKEFLLNTLDGPHTFVLTHNDQKTTSTIDIEARYVPVPAKIDARESINNQGSLRVDLLTGSDITGVDRGGKSDPYAVFSLNGQKVFKSQTKKKTLTPEWNENFVVSVPSRVGSDFSIEVFDWNQIEQAKSLGVAKIELADIEPFQATERTLTLSSSKHGEKGQVRIRMMFQPELIAKTRKNTSTFSTAGRAVTQIGTAPIGAGKGVIHGVAGVFKRSHKEEDPNGSAADAPPGQASQPVGLSDNLVAPSANLDTVPRDSTDGGNQETGSLRVTVLDAKDLASSDIKPYVVLRVGAAEHKTKHSGKTSTPEWNETFTFTAGPMTPKLFAWVYDHKTLGKDKVLGEAEIDIWRHVQSTTSSSADVFAELKEGGLLRVRLEFDTESPPLARSSMSIHKGSNSRFTIRGKKGDE